MNTQVDFRIIDYTLFAIANVVNILMIGIMLSRPTGLKRVEIALGLVLIALALPVGLAVIMNFLGK